MNRRGLFARLFQALLALPLFGLAVGALSPLLRLLRPTLKPLNLNQEPDQPAEASQRVASERDFPIDWAMVDFTFFQKNFEYTPRGENKSLVPGFAVRIPQEIYSQWQGTAPAIYELATANNNDGVLIFSRICPHLGCIFNYFSVDDPRGADWYPAKIRTDYGFPGANLDQSYFACPCHFSVYDLKQVAPDLQAEMRVGRVISGPAPRPPRQLVFDKRNDEYWVTGVEAGGVS